MRHQNTICHDLLKAMPRWRFESFVEQGRGEYRERALSFWSQFVALLYAQLSGAQTLRETVTALESHANLLYHLGMDTVHRSSLSDANRDRPAEVFKAAFEFLLSKLQASLASEAREAIRLIDASVLPLNATLHQWARVGTRSCGAKLHLVYDPKAACPTFFSITPARVNDIVEAKKMPIHEGAIYVFDKAFYDFGWWAELHRAGCIFVTRLKKNSPVHVVKNRKVVSEGIVSDRIVRLNERMAKSRRNPFTAKLREIVVESDNDKTLRLVTNDLRSPARRIAALYKARWEIELFFKWVKQNLKLRKFVGTSENAVKIQIIVALIAFVLLRIAQHRFASLISLKDFTRKVRSNLMHRKSIEVLLRPPPLLKPPENPQLSFAMAIA